MSEKVTGYLLLIAGLLAIAYACVSVFKVFTGKAQPVQLFRFESVSLDVTSLFGDTSMLTATQQTQLSQQKTQDLISSDMINQTSNIAAHLFLMGFVVNVGAKVATIGTQFLRPIKVNLKEEKISPSISKH